MSELESGEANELPEWELQGEFIIGDYAETLTNPALEEDYVSVASTTTAGAAVTLTDAQLFVNGRAIAINTDLPLRNGNGYLRVSQVTTISARVTGYTLTHFPTSGNSIDFCHGHGLAVPLAGVYTSTRTHVAIGGAITFACANAAGSKCILWGYIPGGPKSEGWRYHQGCTRMANNDECGTGGVGTRELTSIDIRDRKYRGKGQPDIETRPLRYAPVPVPGVAAEWPIPPDEMFFEAGWKEDGAMCRSRRRWLSMPENDTCDGKLPDPRVVAGAQYCEEMFPKDIPSDWPQDVLLLNASFSNDMRLRQWEKGNDRVTTARGYYHPNPLERVPPWPGYTPVAGSDEGILIRVLPGSLSATTPPVYDEYQPAAELGLMIELSLQRSGADRVLTTTGGAPGYATSSLEGYVFPDKASASGYQPLILQSGVILPGVLDWASGHSVQGGYSAQDLLGYPLVDPAGITRM